MCEGTAPHTLKLLHIFQNLIEIKNEKKRQILIRKQRKVLVEENGKAKMMKKLNPHKSI